MKTCHKDFFQEHGLKNTPSRDAVFHLLENQLMTAEQLYQQMTEDGYSLSFSTVYRILEKFLEKNIIEIVKFQNETSVYYQLKINEHHHQLVCTKCRHIENIEECPLEAIEQSVAEKHHFVIEHHQMVFYGVCQQCQQKNT
jgi:Fur family transcriptional regulator, ferric uptake regulator